MDSLPHKCYRGEYVPLMAVRRRSKHELAAALHGAIREQIGLVRPAYPMSSVQPAAITPSTRSACCTLIRLRRGLNSADSVAMRCFGKWLSGYEIMEQLAYA